MTDITGSTGTSLAWTEYQPFGLVRAAASTSQAPVNPFRFTGEYRDPTTGHDHLRARQYDPTTGRFLALDPVSPGVGDPYVGAYVYVMNNPVRYTDPSGRCLQFLAAGLVAALPTGGTSAVAGSAMTLGCAVVLGTITVVAAVAAWDIGSAAGKALAETRGDPSLRPLKDELDLRPSTPLIVPLGPSELGYGTPGGGSQLPSVCRAMRLSWKACIAAGLTVTAAGGLPFFAHENEEGVAEEEPHDGK